MIGVVADDITGSNDIGIMFAKSNYTVNVFSFNKDGQFTENCKNTDVLVFDTDSRFDKANEAYQKVYEATKALKTSGATQFINKTCSVFRGNIGAEFDAMLDALNEEFAVVVLGFPKNGRQTINGIHYVHNQLLEESEFRNDPVHPMKESNLVAILQSQTNRKVTSVNYEVVRAGSKKLRETILSKRENYHYVIVDVTDQNDLNTIAQAVYDMKIVAGSSALAEEIPKVLGKKDGREVPASMPPYHPKKGLFCAAGSLMPQTATQIQYMKDKGVKVYELPSVKLLDPYQHQKVLEEFKDQIITEINNGMDVILHSTNERQKVQATKELAQNSYGLSNREVSRLVSSTIADITYSVLEQTGQKRFVIAGGDTSASVCRKLGINGMRVWEEIEPGLPSCISLTEEPYLFVLKSGSFGSKDFFDKAFRHIREQLMA